MWINGDKWQIKDEYVQGISTKVHAEINKYIAEQQEDGYFIFPFFVRYAYRLYDGSVIMQSAPVLMLPNDSGAPDFYRHWLYILILLMAFIRMCQQ